jgi:hypothetical protein
MQISSDAVARDDDLAAAHADQAGFELFRHAIVERDEQAWARIHDRYRTLLIGWARRSAALMPVHENFGDIADQALMRAWLALTPARFERFSGLPALLGYLRSCVATVLIDMARTEQARERMLKRLACGGQPSPEEIVLNTIDSRELWALVARHVGSAQDEAILRLHIVHGLPPREVQARRPDLFPAVGQVYAIKRNLIGRLRRDRALEALVGR